MSLVIPSSDTPLTTNNRQISKTIPDADAGIIIIGAGMAGSRFAIELARARQSVQPNPGPTHRPLPITLISKETQVGYNRIMLSPVLAGERAFDETYLYDKAEYEQLGITVLAGVSVNAVDTNEQLITLDDGQMLPYAKLVLATGSSARIIPFAGHEATGVHVFREIADAEMLSQYASLSKTGIVIGGGVLGLEAACALAAQGASMSVVHMDDYVLNRQLDMPAAQLLQAELASRGVGIEVSALTERIVTMEGKVCGLALQDGRTLAADFIVMAVGVVPNVALAVESGLEVNHGIRVDRYMHTSAANVYAIGECVELDGELFGMVAPVNEQVDTLVSVLKETVSKSTGLNNSALKDDGRKADNAQAKESWQPFISKPLSLKLKVSGISAFSAGQVDFDKSEAATIETITYQQTRLNHYHCLYIKNNTLIGAVLYGEVSEGGFYSQLISAGTDISSIKTELIYGAAYCDLTEIVAADGLDKTLDIENELDKVGALL